ncbi:MAG: DUF4365 domain-containing protein [Snowella sp.]|nr:DUF4365 domain-containing protein [Snowella sp.]
MSNHLTDIIGERGEIIFELAVTHYQTFGYPIFKPVFLGEKWPDIDYYVQLLQIEDITPFFFVQIKSTQNDINNKTKKLSIRLTKEQRENLFKMTAPTYLVGIHEPTQRAFIRSVHTKPTQGIYQISLKYELTPNNLKVLHQEVYDFWKNTVYKPFTSAFL